MLKTLLLLTTLTLASAAEKPNIVLIFCDDLGYGDLSSFGAEKWKTPHIDSLGTDGAKLTDFYVPHPVCTESRAALLTGCYATRLGLKGALGPDAEIGLAEDETTLAELVKGAGYATGMFGKWHLGHHKQFLPTHNGFDTYLGFPYSNDMWPNGPVEFQKKFPPLPLIEGDETLRIIEDQRGITTALTEESVQFIDDHKTEPFFLYLAHPQPHVPLYVSELRTGTADSLLGDVLQEIDWSTGEILAALEKNGLAENTWVIFTSDNGPWMTYGNHAGDTAGLAGQKASTWEGGVRVPCFMRWPGKIKPGTVISTPLATIDLFPTVAKLLDQKLPDHPIDGKNFLPVLTGEQTEPVQEAYFFSYNHNLQGLRMGPWKLVLPHTWQDQRFQPGMDGHRGKSKATKAELALYNLETDRSETTDLSKENPEILKKMQALAQAHLDEIAANKREPGRLKK